MDAKMTKQTPGPWKQLGLSPELVVATHAEGHVVHICTVNSHPYETRAINARLIAAAPDLLAALENCTAALQHCMAVMPHDDPLYPKVEVTDKSARAAIAKAKEQK